MSDRSRLYFEGHITLDHVNTQKTKDLAIYAENVGFKMATFLMVKEDSKLPEAFISCRDESYVAIANRMKHVCQYLRAIGFTVKRAKIEDTLYDTKHGDPEL